MARLVLVEFDNDKHADAFIAKLDSANKPNYRVVGLFARPRQWCECPKPTGYEKNEVVLGGRFGLWVHRLCRRPRRGTHQPHNLMEPRLSNDKYTMIFTSVAMFEAPTKNLKAAREARDNG